MFCRKTFFSKIHHRALKVISGIDDSYNTLLLSSNSIHQSYLRFLVTEIFKSISQINPELMWSFKQKKLPYNLRKRPILNYQELSPPTAAQMLLTLKVLTYGTIFLLKLNPAFQFSNLKPKLKI